jgi:hypothetical protein
MSNERLDLVTDFGSLKAGDLVVLKPCKWCDRDHRGMLLAFVAGAYGLNKDGEIEVHDGWTTTIPSHRPKPSGCCLIGGMHVADRRVYRVIIPPAQEARETARPKKLERVR